MKLRIFTMSDIMNVTDLPIWEDSIAGKWCYTCGGSGVLFAWMGTPDERRTTPCIVCGGSGYCKSYHLYLERLIIE